MNAPNPPATPTVLVAPLDWGLGHATRCVPIIKILVNLKCRVLVAASGPTKALLEKEFPNLLFLELEGYGIRYASKRAFFTWQLLRQLPRLIRIIKKENNWLKQVVKDYAIDAVLSDNRYGLYHSEIATVIITHQLQIQTGLGTLADTFLRKLHYRFITRFQECWVPDLEGKVNLAGRLSHPRIKPAVPVHYLGLLSRLRPVPSSTSKHLVLLLSGPEPQRTLLEKLLLQQLDTFTGSAVLLRGLPAQQPLPALSTSITVYNHLAAPELGAVLSNASLVICRSGYSSIMDLAALKKKCFLIPTPGQTEQEYLARHLESIGFAPFSSQDRFNLDEALKEAATFSYHYPDNGEESQAEAVLNAFIQALSRNKSH